jgi:prevent-host-death family protein
MKALRADEVVPLAEFKTHASQVINRVRTSGRPVLITQHGRGAAVLISVAEYDRLFEGALIRAAIEEGLADAAAGRVFTEEEAFAQLEAKFGPLPEGDLET